MPLTTQVAPTSQQVVAADNPKIEYTGRIDFSNAQLPVFSYSGVSIRATFHGSDISAKIHSLSGVNYFNVIIDGKEIKRLKVDTESQACELANGLTASIHEVEIFKLTEVEFGAVCFGGFIFPKGGDLVDMAKPRTRMIEFIGDSITCGFGNEGMPGDVFSPETENHYLTYAAIVSRNFNARHFAVCKSGIGIYRNWDDPAEGGEDCLPRIYTRIFHDQPSPVFDFKTHHPDLICINLGTNDFSMQRGDTTRFVNAYLAFIDRLQNKNPKTDIVCLMGPIISGNDKNIVRHCLEYIAQTATANGKGKVYFFEMSEQGSLGFGIDSHPNVSQNAKNAKELTQFISKLKKWRVVSDAIDEQLGF